MKATINRKRKSSRKTARQRRGLDIRLARIRENAEDVRARAEGGGYLTMAEIAFVSGFSISKVHEMRVRPGFPIIEGRVRWADFNAWLKASAAPPASLAA